MPRGGAGTPDPAQQRPCGADASFEPCATQEQDRHDDRGGDAGAPRAGVAARPAANLYEAVVTRTSRIVAALLLLGAAAALAAVGAAAARDIAAARARVAAGSAIAATPCGPIEYATLGAGPAVLMVHGAGGGWDQGLALGRDLAAQGFRVVAMSRFGYLRTPLPADASAAAQADAHACLLDALGIERAVVVGASAGAPSTLQIALRHPARTRGIALLVPAAWMPDAAGGTGTTRATAWLFDTALRSDALYWAALHLARDALLGGVLATPPELVHAADAGEQARADAILREVLPISARRAGLLNDAAVVSTLERVPLQRIAAPALVVSVRDDRFDTWRRARWTAQQLPDARFVDYERGGHVWIGHHAELMNELTAFVRRAGE
jgi:pimeloyl-ACP methyl ester carboxylesterase